MSFASYITSIKVVNTLRKKAHHAEDKFLLSPKQIITQHVSNWEIMFGLLILVKHSTPTPISFSVMMYLLDVWTQRQVVWRMAKYWEWLRLEDKRFQLLSVIRMVMDICQYLIMKLVRLGSLRFNIWDNRLIMDLGTKRQWLNVIAKNPNTTKCPPKP